ncbi:MAG: POTRA domain-containing protein, partial [Mycobacterium sp.]
MHNAYAQRNLPSTVSPGQIERRFQTPPAPRSSLQITPAIPKQRLAPAAAKKIHFTLRRLEIVGATVYKPEALLPLYKKYLGRRISVADLYRIADAITVKYRNAGYILSRAFVPAQKINDGTTRIEVIEGYVDGIQYRGRPPGRDDLFAYWNRHIMQSRPLQLAVLERYLLLAGDLAGANVRSVFEPSKKHVGAATLIVILTEKHVDLHADLDNRGTRTLGPLQLNAGWAINDGFGLYGRSAFNFVVTPQAAQELQYYNFTQAETLDGEGTKASLSLSYVHTHPGDFLSPLDVEGRDTA